MNVKQEWLERRTNIILLQYWNQLRGDRDFPPEDELDPDAIDEVWGHCFLIQVRDIEQVHHYNYSYWGPDLNQAYISGPLEPDNGKMVMPEANKLSHLFNEVLESGDPLLDEDSYLNGAGQLIKFRQCMLPLGPQGGPIDSILGGAWFKIG